MRKEELMEIQVKFEQGVQKLMLLKTCLASVSTGIGLKVSVGDVEGIRGALMFLFAGEQYYIRVRITDRDVDDVGGEYRVPVGWLDWGRVGLGGDLEMPMQSNYFDDRGILCELEKEEFYCDFTNCDDDRVVKGVLHTLSKLVGRSIALNNAR